MPEAGRPARLHVDVRYPGDLHGLCVVAPACNFPEASRAVSRLVTTLSCVAPVLPVHPPPARSGPSPVPPPLRCPHHTRHPPAWSLLQLVGCWVIMMSYLLIIRLHFNIPRFSLMRSSTAIVKLMGCICMESMRTIVTCLPRIMPPPKRFPNP